MTNRYSVTAFVAIVGVAMFLGYQARTHRQLVVEVDNRDLQETQIAIGQAQLTALAPTETPYVTSTPTKTPKPATATAAPTYGPDASPGLYVVPVWTPVPLGTVDAATPEPCVLVTPDKYDVQLCEVTA